MDSRIRIERCDHYDAKLKHTETWYEVHERVPFLWFWHKWRPVTEWHFSYGGGFTTPIRFRSLTAVEEYLDRRKNRRPGVKRTLVLPT